MVRHLLAYLLASSSITIPLPVDDAANGALKTAAETRLSVDVLNGLSNTDDNNRFVIVNLRNTSTSPTENIALRFHLTGSPDQTRIVGRLAAGQVKTEVYDVPRHVRGGYLIADYEADGGKESLGAVFSVTESARWQPFLTLMAPTFSTLAGTLIGAWLLHAFTFLREKRKSDLEWKKMLFDKYEKAYLTFLNQWGESVSGQILRTQFSELRSSSIVPTSIVDSYERVLETLSKPDLQDEEKRALCRNFRKEIIGFLKNPLM